MNKKKRYLIIAAAILNLVGVALDLILSILLMQFPEIPDWLYVFYEIMYALTFHTTGVLLYSVLFFAFGLAGSILLFWSVRKGGKYFRTSQGIYITGFAFVVIFGGWIPWILLLIQMFIPDVIVMNTRSEVRKQERDEVIEAQNLEKERSKMMEEKRKKIEELKKLRDDGVISEEEYKQKLFEIL